MKLVLITYTGDLKEFQNCFHCKPEIKIKAKNETEALKFFFERKTPFMSEETKKDWKKNMNIAKISWLNPATWFIDEVKPFKIKKFRRLTFNNKFI